MSARHVYVHVPFCARRCVYCDFAIAVRRSVPVAAFVDALLAEVRRRSVGGAPLQTLYFGGGTPSRLGGAGVAEMLSRLREHFPLAPEAEVTLEVNPEDVTVEAARWWAQAGVNRVSLGVQSFHAATLAWMHRGHDVPRVHAAVQQLREAGIGNVSIDLIYAIPHALGRDWARDLDQALALEPAHVSCYGLTIETGTPLGRRVHRQEDHAAADETHEREFLEANRRLVAAGFEHYEVSNYGLPGQHSRHNRCYWDGVAYLGLGPSAHGFDGSVRRWNIPALAAWERAVAAGRDPMEGEERLTADQILLERTYLDLRTTRGVLITSTDEPTIQPWLEAGWATRHGDRLRLTPSGWMRLDALVSALTEHRSRY